MLRGMSDVQDFVHLLKALPRDWRAVLDRRLQPLGLSQAKWQLLLYLHREGCPRTQTEVADHLDIESPTVVRQLDRLAADGWIERKSCPGDRRARHIVLTPRAKRVCAKIETVVAEVRGHLLAGISPTELATCLKILRRVHATAAQLLDAPVEPAPAVAAVPASKASSRRARAALSA
ncbi:MAG: MarR family transcriptional regulator [Nevskia sp.]